MSKLKTLIVTDENQNQRLDMFLSEKLKLSRTLVQKMITADQITINGKQPRTAGMQVKKEYKITIASEAAKTSEAKTSVQKRNRASKERALTPELLAETPDFIIINKPSGLLVHPTMAKETNALTAWLIKKYPKIKTVGDDPIRPGIVHRLDKEASGLMVVAKTQAMFDHLKNQFKDRTIEKEYLALVHDKVARDYDDLTFPIARAENSDRMAARPVSADSVSGEKEARTEFWTEEHFKNFSLLRVKIHTGRMHQIRAHFLAYNHPLVGDPIYFQKKRKHAWDEKLGRLFLHSTKLSFTDLSGRTQTFESPLPKELSNFLKLLVKE